MVIYDRNFCHLIAQSGVFFRGGERASPKNAIFDKAGFFCVSICFFKQKQSIDKAYLWYTKTEKLTQYTVFPLPAYRGAWGVASLKYPQGERLHPHFSDIMVFYPLRTEEKGAITGYGLFYHIMIE